MNKTVLYLILLAASFLVPRRGTEIGMLRPVELVHMYEQDGKVVLKTDTEDKGTGETVLQALQNMKDTTAGTIFLDTAYFLMVSENAVTHIPEMQEYLSPHVRVCSAAQGTNLEEAARFLSAHKPQKRLREVRTDAELQRLTVKDGRMYLTKKLENSA